MSFWGSNAYMAFPPDPQELRANAVGHVVEADVGGHRRDEDVPDALQRPDRDGLALEISDRADALGPEQLEAADVDSRQEDDGILRVDAQEKRSTERRVEMGLAGGQITPLRGPGIG